MRWALVRSWGLNGSSTRLLASVVFRQSLTRRRPRPRARVAVVTPYNAQVNLLKSLLPADARIGTVDKFQGQEAPVCLVSMATSSGEELPRDIEFLFSVNRLNVAVSRAQALSIVFASPRLLDVPCRTVEQMRLVNALCAVADYASRSEPVQNATSCANKENQQEVCSPLPIR